MDPDLELNFDVSRINWRHFVQNHGYGIKKYILGEETYMPSQGYNDLRGILFNVKLARWVQPWKASHLFHKKVASFEEMKKVVFGTDWVKSEMEKLYQKRMDELT